MVPLTVLLPFLFLASQFLTSSTFLWCTANWEDVSGECSEAQGKEHDDAEVDAVGAARFVPDFAAFLVAFATSRSWKRVSSLSSHAKSSSIQDLGMGEVFLYLRTEWCRFR